MVPFSVYDGPDMNILSHEWEIRGAADSHVRPENGHFCVYFQELVCGS